jgi:hypothetical protein
MLSSGMLRRVTLVRTDVSEELSASFIRMTRIGELGTTLAAHGATSQKTPFFSKPSLFRGNWGGRARFSESGLMKQTMFQKEKN